MKLFASWVGEFGWELFCFQGIIRQMSKDFDKITICARKGHERLYKDFMTDFIPLEITGETDCANCVDYIDISRHTEGFDKVILPKTQIVFYSPFKYAEWLKTKQSFVRYGRDKHKYKYKYLIHARNTSKFNTTHRNWGRENWLRIIPELKGRIATFGTIEGSLGFDGVEDLRGIPLSQLVNHIASSEWVIGESSGAMHLASLCRTNQIVISEGFNKIRYLDHWNPFNTKVKFISNSPLRLDVNVSDVLRWI